jgi:hypothetical protein
VQPASSIGQSSGPSSVLDTTVVGRLLIRLTHGSPTPDSPGARAQHLRELPVGVGPEDHPLLRAVHGETVVEQLGALLAPVAAPVAVVGAVVSFSFDMRPKAAMRLAFPLLRNTIAAQVKANIGRLPSALAEAGEI